MPFEALLSSAERSVVHLEARDTYDPTDPAFVEWQQTGDTSYEWDDWIELIGGVVARGVRFRRLRIVSEPVSDYIRWEHAISYGNVEAGEELRWLAYDCLLGKECLRALRRGTTDPAPQPNVISRSRT